MNVYVRSIIKIVSLIFMMYITNLLVNLISDHQDRALYKIAYMRVRIDNKLLAVRSHSPFQSLEQSLVERSNSD